MSESEIYSVISQKSCMRVIVNCELLQTQYLIDKITNQDIIYNK